MSVSRWSRHSIPAARCVAAAGLVAVTCAAAAPTVSEEPRVTVSLDAGWRFKQATELTGVESGSFDDSGWAPVDVPHTWNRIGNEGTERSPLSNSAQGVGWYRLRFKA